MTDYNQNQFHLQPPDEQINIKKLLSKYLNHWKWIILSILLFSVISYFYLRTQINIYQSEAKVLVKDTRKGGLSMDLDIFSDLGFGSANSNVYNEIEMFNTRTLIREVVRDLSLQESLKKETGLSSKNELYYKNAPIKTNLTENELNEIKKGAIFELQITKNNKLKVKEFFSDKPGSKIEVNHGEISFNQTISTSVGDLYFTKNDSLNTEIGENYLLHLKSVESVVDELRENFSIEAVSKDVSVISIKYKGPIIEMNNDIIDNLIYQHEQRTIRDKNEITLSTSFFIKDRMQLIENELSNVEDSSQAFKFKNRLIDVESDAAMFLSKESSIEKSITETSIQLAMAKFMNDFIKEAHTLNELLPANLGFTDASIAELTAEYNKLVLERNRLLSSSSAKNPRVTQLESQLISIRQSLKESLDKLQRTLEVNLQMLRNQESQYKSKLANIPAYEREYRELLRQQQIKETLYLYLLQKREENEIAMASTLGSVKVLDSAFSTKLPIAPKKKLIFLGALLLGLLIPIVVIYLLDMMDTNVKSRQELEHLGIPFLGDIPFHKGNEKLVVTNEGRSSTVEAIRMLRANMNFLLNDNIEEKGKVIFVSSTIAGEGKTFITINLSNSIAMTAKKVLVLGLDLRAPKLAKYLDIDRNIGVSDYIVRADLNLADITHKANSNRYFDLILSGTVPPNPGELLFHPRTAELFDKLKTEYDYIVVDSAPIGVVVDTISILHQADLLLYVVRYNYLDREALQLPKKILSEGKVKAIATILNSTDSKKVNYGGYGYGYDNNEKLNFWQKWFKKTT